MNIHYKKVRRVVITGPMGEYMEATRWINKNGYRIMESGSKEKANMDFDFSKFRFVAEKEIKE